MAKFVFCAALILFLASCDDPKLDGKYFAQRYCNCLSADLPKREAADLYQKCTDSVLRESRYFRLYTESLSDTSYPYHTEKKLRDSIRSFMQDFDSYINVNCEHMLKAPDSLKGF